MTLRILRSRIDRRSFLKRAGLGSIALGAVPALGSGLARPVSADGNEAGFNFTPSAGRAP